VALVTEYAYQGPEPSGSDFDRAVLLAHGAGSDMDGAALRAVADVLAASRIPSLRFNYPYRTAGRKAPDRPAMLLTATREAGAELARRTQIAPEQLVLGGRSMGGRYCSLAAADEADPVPARGLLLLGYPLHAAGRPEARRDDHFRRLSMPVCFVSGTRDALAGRADLTRSARSVRGDVTFHWVDTADHAYRPLKSSGRTLDDVLGEVATVATEWVTKLRG
jgi:predicted alpha/beta-hydrolase family hydrolase